MALGISGAEATRLALAQGLVPLASAAFLLQLGAIIGFRPSCRKEGN
jgi:hypothetical protein